MMTVLNACNVAKELIARGQHRNAVATLEPLLRRSPESLEMHETLVEAYMALREPAKAVPHIEACLALDRTNRTMKMNLGATSLDLGRFDDAERVFREALRMPRQPCEPVTAAGVSRVEVNLHAGLGAALKYQEKSPEAIEQYELALKDDPGHVQANSNLANIYARQGKNPEAIQHYLRVLKTAPDTYDTRKDLGLVFCRVKEYAQALTVWREGLTTRPNDAPLLYLAAWWLATCPDAKCRDGRSAVALAERLCDATRWGNAQALDTLAAAYAETADFAKAGDTARTALILANAAGDRELARDIGQRLGLYSASKPYHQ